MRQFSTKKLLVAVALALGLGSTASAQSTVPDGYIEVENYSEDFNSAVGSSSISTYPLGWSRFTVSGDNKYAVNSSGRTNKCVGNGYSSNGADPDYIVTTPVKGNIKFYVKKYSSSYTPLLEVYKLTKTDDGFSVDATTDKIFEYPASGWTTTSWEEVSLPDALEDYEYLGIKLGYGYIDDFEATLALVPIKKALTISSANLTGGGNTVSAKEDGTVDISVDVTVRNDGNVKLSKATEGSNYTMSLARYLRWEVGGNVYEQPYINTVDLPDLESGESSSFTITGNYQVPTDVNPNSYGEILISLYVLENFTPNFKSVTDLYIKPYEAIMNIRYDQHTSYNEQLDTIYSTSTDVAGKNIYLGAAKGSVSRVFSISNGGPKKMNVTSYEAPAGFTVEGVDFPFEVENGKPQELTVKISGESGYGYKEGKVKFIFDGIALCDSIKVSGDIVPDDVFFADFEDYADNGLKSWYAPSGSTSWSVGEYSSSPDERLRTTSNNTYWPEYRINDGRLSNGLNKTPGEDLISPLMSFDAGDKISFYAAKKTNYGNDVKLIVSYSPDRNNWVELGTITPTVAGTEVNAFPGVGQYSGASGQNMLKRFEFEIPEAGNYYIKLTAGYVLVDNFVGGVIVDVPYDIVSESAKAGGVKMVNNNVILSANFKNIASSEVAAEDQVVTLYADGAPVATAEAKVLPIGEDVTYDLSYVPHTDGETTLYAEIAIGDYKVTSPSVTVKIAEEAAVVLNQIGTYTDGTSSTYPFQFNWTHSGGESIYLAEELQNLASDEITQMSLVYTKTDAHGASRVKIWMENTDDSDFSETKLHDWTDDNLVFSDDNFVVGATGDDFEELKFIFDTPFTYERGKNVRIGFSLICNTDGSVANSELAKFQTSDDRGSVTYLKWNKDNENQLDNLTPSKTTAKQPIIYLYTEKTVPSVSGTVKDSEGNAVVGAAVKAQSGEVIYETVSGDAGAWEMKIFQPENQYSLTVSAEGYEDFSGTLDLENPNEVTLTKIVSNYDQFEGLVEVADWSEPFATNPVSGGKFVAPEGWNNVEDGVTYTNSSHGTGSSIGTQANQKTGETYDLLVTPPVKGTLTFDVKRYAYAATFVFDVQFFKLTKNEDGSFTRGEEIPYTSPFEEGSTSISWVEGQTIDVGNDYTYVGIRLSSGYIDEFKAPNAMRPIKKSISLGTISHKQGYSASVNADEDNNVTIGITIPVTNNGNVPLVADEEGESYAVSFARAISTSSPYSVEIISSKPLPDLAVGETTTIEFEETFPVPEDITPDSNGNIRFRVDVVEQFTNEEIVSGVNSKACSWWYEVKPYTSILRIDYDKKSNYNSTVTSTQVDPEKPIDYGVFVGERSIDFRMTNRGPAVLTFESIQKPDWVTINNLPESIPVGNDTITISVVISGDPGVKSGSIKFNTNGAPLVDEISLKGEVVSPDVFFADFEGEEGLDAWYIPDSNAKWSLGSYTETERDASENFNIIEFGVNDKMIVHGSRLDNVEDIYSPKLAFEDGESFSFYAAKKTNSGSDVLLKVSYSEDRANWTELGTIKVTNDENPDLQFSSGTSSITTSAGQNILKRFSFTMPEGEYYICLGGSYVFVDNFIGGVLVDVPYDVAPESLIIGSDRVVNYPITVSASFKNLGSDIEADIQTATLYVDGVAVDTAEGKAFASNESVSYDFTYTPHSAGSAEVYVELSINDFSVKSPVEEIEIKEESAEDRTQIGEEKATNINIPFNLMNKNSRSEFILTADDLAELPSNRIVKLSFLQTTNDKPITGDNVVIYLQNTDDTNITETTFTPLEEMTLVCNADDVTYSSGQGGIYEEIIFTFDTPFTLEAGKNLRVSMIQNTEKTQWHQYRADNNARYKGRTSIYATSSVSRDDLLTKAGTKVNDQIPVTIVYTEDILEPVTGTVKTADGLPVEGATVTATAVDEDVFYTATSDVDGNWQMTIFRSDLSYTVSASKEGVGQSKPVALDMTAPNNLVLAEEEIEEIPAPVRGSYECEWSDDTHKTQDVTIIWDMPGYDDDLEALSDDAAPAYNFHVHLNGEKHGETGEFEYKINGLSLGSHEVKIYNVVGDNQSEPLVINMMLDETLGVTGIEIDPDSVRYFNLNGLEIKAENLENGIYIRVSGNKSEKVLINN